MRILLLLALCLAAVAAVPRDQQRIVGGSTTTISQYPSIVALLYSWNLNTYTQWCGGILINNRSVLSAAHCFVGDAPVQWRMRFGSTFANSGGTVYTTQSITLHALYTVGARYNNDLAMLRSQSNIVYVNNAVQAAMVAGPNYNIPDGAVVWAAGWGDTSFNGFPSETLRNVQVWVINQNTCVNRYREIGGVVTDNMLCSGWLDVGGRDQCQGDSGGPLYHNGVLVGVCSWGYECARARYPGVNVRVPRYTAWIQGNA